MQWQIGNATTERKGRAKWYCYSVSNSNSPIDFIHQPSRAAVFATVQKIAVPTPNHGATAQMMTCHGILYTTYDTREALPVQKASATSNHRIFKQSRAECLWWTHHLLFDESAYELRPRLVHQPIRRRPKKRRTVATVLFCFYLVIIVQSLTSLAQNVRLAEYNQTV